MQSLEDLMFYILVLCHACLMIVQEERDESMINNKSLAHEEWD